MNFLLSKPAFCAVLLVGAAWRTAPLHAQETKAPEKVCRVFRVPPDFLSRGAEPGNDAAPPPADPFAAPGPHESSGLPPARPADHWPRFPHVIHALGEDQPVDARSVLESFGVTFAEGDGALLPANSDKLNILFVKTSTEQMDAVEVILSGLGWHDPKHLHVTYRVRQTGAGGRAKDLLERAILIRSGQRAKFQRHREGNLVEDEEMEATVDADGVTVVDSDLKFHLKGLSVQTNGQAFLRSGDPDPVVLYTGTGSSPRSKLEVLASVKILDRIPGEGVNPIFTNPKLAAVICAEVTEAEMKSRLVPPQRSELICVNLWPSEKAEIKPVKLSDGNTPNMADARESLRAFKVPLDEGDNAWYWPEARLLFLHAGEKTIAATRGLAVQQGLEEMNRYEVKFAALERKRGKERPFPPRTLLISSGKRAKGTSEVQKGRPELTEAEITVNEARTVADVNLALNDVTFGNETWTLYCQAIATTDGTLPVTLIAGRAADSGGGFKKLQLTVNQRGDHWQELLRDPARKASAIRTVEAALLNPAEGK